MVAGRKFEKPSWATVEAVREQAAGRDPWSANAVRVPAASFGRWEPAKLRPAGFIGPWLTVAPVTVPGPLDPLGGLRVPAKRAAVPGVAWKPIYRALALMLRNGGPMFAIVREKRSKRVQCLVALDGGHGKRADWSDAGSTAGEAHAWLSVNLPGYLLARSAVDAVPDVAPVEAVPAPVKVKRPAKAAVVPVVAPPVDPGPVVPVAVPAAAVAAEIVSVEVEPGTVEIMDADSIRADNAARVLPGWAVDYLGRLVHAPKRAYAAAYVDAVLFDAPMPADPGAPWADKVRARVEWLTR